MPSLSETSGVKASLLDRLSQRRPQVSAGQALRDYRDSVVRDLGHLFNTRAVAAGAVEGVEDLECSLVCYGLPDLSVFNPQSPRDRTTLRRLLLETIRRFEPRLTNVRVDPIESDDKVAHLRFRITGLLKADPRPIDISLDTIFEGDTRRVVVRERP